MKYLTKWFIMAFVGVSILFASCVDQIKFGDSFLEKPPTTSDLNQDSIFGKADYARAFLWNTYSKMYFGLPYNWGDVTSKMNTGVFEALSDCYQSHNGWDGVNRHYYPGSYTAANETGSATRFGYLKQDCWPAIRSSWMFIENVDRVPDMETDEKERLKAEAKCIIASRYFDLFRHFGGLPIIRGTYGVEAEYEIPRGTVDETVKFMVGLLDEASSAMPWSLGTEEDNWQGRFTKAAAMGLKCKILLFAASPLFNDNEPYCTEPPQEAVTNLQVWYGGYNADLWQQCWQACYNFFEENAKQGNAYSLIQAKGTSGTDYREAFNKAYFIRENNTELLISTRVTGKYGGEWWHYWGTNNDSEEGWPNNRGYTPTLEFMEMFPMSDGKAFDPEVMLADGADPFFENNDRNKPVRDPRLYETMLVNGASYDSRGAELWLGGRDNLTDTEKETNKTATGFRLYKFWKEGKGSFNGTYLEWPYLRLSELYLIYAEAILKAKNDLVGAIAQVDIVRGRVGLGGLAECNPDKHLTSNSDALLEEILRERACELGFEDVRLFDMIRYKRADLFQKKLHGLKVYRNDGSGKKPWSGSDGNSAQYPWPTEFTYEPFVLSARSWWTNFSPKWYLSAFPVAEINKGYGLTQNPGW